MERITDEFFEKFEHFSSQTPAKVDIGPLVIEAYLVLDFATSFGALDSCGLTQQASCVLEGNTTAMPLKGMLSEERVEASSGDESSTPVPKQTSKQRLNDVAKSASPIQIKGDTGSNSGGSDSESDASSGSSSSKSSSPAESERDALPSQTSTVESSSKRRKIEYLSRYVRRPGTNAHAVTTRSRGSNQRYMCLLKAIQPST